MDNFYCREDVSLTDAEKNIFAAHLEQQGISNNIWDLFQLWVDKSTPIINFFYLKVYNHDELTGLGLFIKLKPFDLRTSYSGVRKNIILNKLFLLFSKISSNCVYISLRNLITSNIVRPFFYKDPEEEDLIMKTILLHLKNEKKADMISILDTSENDDTYNASGYGKYLSPSEGSFDATQYTDISEYLNEHKNLKRNLKRRRDIVETEVLWGPVSGRKN